MPLTAGDQLGPYEILGPIGAGGMGEVYRAHDSKLKRDVALKVLPAAFATDAERLARFAREAQVLASLNHPNIAQVYGVEDRALVMELVEGKSPQGPMPFDDAWKIASQIADALEYAHEKGIIHRDLKPANVKVTPEGVVKLLDFGLAKAFSNQSERSDAPGDPANSPTLTIGATVAGTIMGTAAYMAPEQAKGKRVDKRADIWAWGVVLYDLITGERMFRGEDAADTLAQVLTKEANLEGVPMQVRPLLRDCLQKDPKLRLRDIGDAKRLLAQPAPDQASVVPAPAGWSRATGWIAAGVLAVALAVALWAPWRAARSGGRNTVRLNADLGPEAIAAEYNTFALSPDGQRLAFTIRGADRKTRLATRLLQEVSHTPLSGTENAQNPFFSPDSQWVGFFADAKLKKVPVLGGAPVSLCDAPIGMGASWAEDGTIIASVSSTNALVSLPSAGGAPQPFTKLGRNEITHRWPQVLPGGENVLFTAGTTVSAQNEANIVGISRKTGQTTILIRGGYYGRYIPGPDGGTDGYLLYVREGALFAVEFDPVRLVVKGTPIPLIADIAGEAVTGAGHLDVSRSGTLVYRPGRESTQRWPVLWLDRAGQNKNLIAEPGFYLTPQFSPDGRKLALAMQTGAGSDIYLYDLDRASLLRLTTAGKDNFLVSYPYWMPDGKHIVFRYPSSSGYGIAWYRTDGGGVPQLLYETARNLIPTSLSPDGKSVLFQEIDPNTFNDIWVLPLDTADPDHPKPGKPVVFLRTPASEYRGAFSPDGRWIAYGSDESGRREVYVRPYPGPGGKWQISSEGGSSAFWSRDGRSIYFEGLDNRMMVLEYEAKGDAFVAGKPRTWSENPVRDVGSNISVALHPDGQRFAVFPPAEPSPEEKGNAHVTFLLNFADELRRRIVAGK